jgi:hypothetical protein
MESSGGFSQFSFSVWAVLGIVVGVLVAYLVFVMLCRAKTMPKFAEGFGAPVVGAGQPDCLRESNEAAAIIGAFQDRVGSVEEGNPDLDELKVLLGKLCCMKRDLVAVNGTVNATLYQPFMTAHDIEPVAETTGRCFAKTIPERDLSLSFDKWKTRGRFLISRLCSASDMTPTEKGKMDSLFDQVLVDVYDIAQQRCLAGTPTIDAKATPRDVGAFSPPALDDLREYTGYY